MITLQKCILEQTNITEILRDYNFQVDEETETLVVTNPPTSITAPSPDPTGEKNFTVGSD